MNNNTKAIAKLKKKYSKWPPKSGFFNLRGFLINHAPRSLILLCLKKLISKNDYKMKRESRKFFDLSIRAYGGRRRRKYERFLSIALNLLSSSWPIEYKSLLCTTVRSTFKTASSRGSACESVLLATTQLDLSIFDATGWYQLSRGLFSLGYFRAAWVARENSLELSIAEGTKLDSSATSVSRAIESYLERLDLDSVRKLLDETSVLGTKNLRSFREYLECFEPNFALNSFNKISGLGVSEKVFNELVTAREVALVGPGHPRGEFGGEIDRADTVARVKFVGTANLPEQKFHGSRCNIGYQAALSVLAEYVELGLNIDYYKNIDLFVSSSELLEFGTKPVFNIELSIPMYRTTAVSGIILLYQLIKSSPKTLMVYGYDFRADRKQYSNASRDFYKHNGSLLGHPYPGFDREDLPAWIIACDFCEHDFVSNFCFAQNLYRAGLFDIEPYGKSILELTPYQYVERLEEMLGDW